MERRRFLITTGRLLLLGGIAGVSAVSLRKGQQGDDECTTLSRFCSECGLLSECTLPQAISEREALAK